MQENNASVIAINVLTSPNAAFAALKERPTLLAPLLLLLAAAALTTFLYMHGVDIEWLFGQQAAANPGMTPEQVEQAGQFGEFIASMPPAVVGSLFACSAAIAVAVVVLLQALYFKIVTWITRDGVSYKHWFSMVAWCALPSLLASLASAVKLLTSDVSLMPREAINPLSLANLAGIDVAGNSDLERLLGYFDPMTLWSIVLMILCYRTFTKKGFAFAAGIVLLPTAVLVTLNLAF